MRPVIIVFAKAPIPGRVKTRLLPVITAEQSAMLHRALVLDLIESLQELTGVDIELHTDIPTDAWDKAGVAGRLQCEGDIRLKLLHALSVGLNEGRRRVTIIGSDAPGLPPGHVLTLLEDPSDVTLGPAEDGGYWGIACSAMAREMFDGVSWSTAATLEETAAACGRCKLSVSLGPGWWDVDEPRDLKRLLDEPRLGRWVRSCIESPEWRASFFDTDPGSHRVRPQSR